MYLLTINIDETEQTIGKIVSSIRTFKYLKSHKNTLSNVLRDEDVFFFF